MVERIIEANMKFYPTHFKPNVDCVHETEKQGYRLAAAQIYVVRTYIFKFQLIFT